MYNVIRKSGIPRAARCRYNVGRIQGEGIECRALYEENKTRYIKEISLIW